MSVLQEGMKPLAERLWAKTAIKGPTDCWEWQGWRHPKGHGQIGLGGRSVGLGYTHRVAWEVTNGPVPHGLFVCHKCDNPPCVNPAHLFLGTPAENSADMAKKRRSTYGESAARAKLTEDDIRAIRDAIDDGLYQHAVAKQFGVSRSLVGLIAQRKRWAHI
jgi:hypothetical protein